MTVLPAKAERSTPLELMGHKDIATTMIYVHLARKPGETIKSPLDL